MKYLKIHVRGGVNGEMIYPSGYQTELGTFSVDHLYYEENGACKLLLCIPDKDFKTTMIRTDAEEITEIDAKIISEAKETRTETIKNEVKLRRIEIKSRLGITLTEDEEDSIDLAKPNSVFEVTEILADRIEKIKSNEIALSEEIIK
jgi:hypothetical protein